MHIESTIEKLGYSLNEVKVYLAALELGGSTVTEISEKVQIPRTTVNLIADSLHRRGLMNAYIISRRKIWIAENPEKLMISLKENEATLKIILPELQSLRHDTGAKPMVRTYSGAEEIKQIMKDMMETKHPVMAIFSWDDWMAFFGKSWMDDFIETRVRRYLPIQVLTPRTKTSIALRARDVNELRATRFLPDLITINNSNLIYGNKVAIISVHTKRPVGILIEDEDIHHTMEVLFENLWQQSA